MMYVALLRGINVGGNNRVEMSRLRACFESLGYQQVSTYINSGNVLFSTDTPDAQALITSIEHVISDQFGIRVPVVIRTQPNIAALCKIIPLDWTNDSEHKTDVLFLWPKVKASDVVELMRPRVDVDSYRVLDDTITWHVKRSDSTRSGLHNLIGTKFYKQVTIRNINTVRKINSLMLA